MIQAAFGAPGTSIHCSGPIALTVLTRRSGQAELPVEVYAAVVADAAVAERRRSWMVLKPNQILGYLAAAQG